MRTRNAAAIIIIGVLVLAAVVGVEHARAAGRTWSVAIGADSPDHAVQILDYYPRTITVNAGDTVTWTMGALYDHTVTFLSGAHLPPLGIPQKDGKLLFNPQVVFSQGGPDYNGTGIASSGVLSGLGKRWTVRFTTPGRYTYQCLLHPGQIGTVIVQPAGVPLPMTQRDYDRQAARERHWVLDRGARLRASTVDTKTVTAGGSALYTAPMVGDPQYRIALIRFGTDTLRIRVGDTVRWVMKDPNEIHTVTFAGAEGLPPFLVTVPKPQGPPAVYFGPKIVGPAGGPTHMGEGYYNSGILFPVNPPGPTEYRLTFTHPGTFTYWCVVHVPQGMRGTVIVTP